MVDETMAVTGQLEEICRDRCCGLLDGWESRKMC